MEKTPPIQQEVQPIPLQSSDHGTETPVQLAENIGENTQEIRQELQDKGEDTPAISQKLEEIQEDATELAATNGTTVAATETTEEEIRQEVPPEPRHFWFRKWSLRK
jgi:hypothetical protein